MDLKFNGRTYPAYLKLASISVDYEEAWFMMGLRRMECPHCLIGDFSDTTTVHRLRTTEMMQHRFSSQTNISIKVPFWEYPEFGCIYEAYGCDPLHQIRKGVFGHLLKWLGEYWKSKRQSRKMQEFDTKYVRF